MDTYMRAALDEARRGLVEGGIPIALMEGFIRGSPALWNEDIGE